MQVLQKILWRLWDDIPGRKYESKSFDFVDIKKTGRWLFDAYNVTGKKAEKKLILVRRKAEKTHLNCNPRKEEFFTF